jgi:CRISPR-associated protein Cas2
MTFFICYDITADRLRTHLSKRLEREGCRRIQKSVFVAHDFERKEMERLRLVVQKLLRGSSEREPTDSVLYIPIENSQLRQVVWEGDGKKWGEILEKEYGKVL